ncbi:MAG: Sapep family Mn(2+)-dependent dipeptidase [Christensenellales bacterium]|jgi:succinyl-diaminopimelate desuccinylase
MDTIEIVLKKTFNDAIVTLQEQIRIPSLRSTAKPNKPFGDEINNSLEHILDCAKKMGFKTQNIDGYAGIVEYGEGPKTLGVFCHLDVVPAGSGWSFDPFAAEIHEDRIYGRGSMDNKGPSVSALYALHAISDAKIKLPCKVQLIYGCDEETDWECMKYLAKKQPMPDFGFAPDANYPLSYYEMGIAQLRFKLYHHSEIKICCEGRANVVPSIASAMLPVLEDLHINSSKDIIVEKIDGYNLISAHGIGGHAAHPELARNALTNLISYLSQLPLTPHDLTILKGLGNSYTNYYGEGLGISNQDETGQLTVNLGVLDWNNRSVSFEIDIRYPKSTDRKNLITTVQDKMKKLGFSSDGVRGKESHYVDPKSPLVKILMEIYNRRTGKNSKPFSFSGGTYARLIPKAVTFGCDPSLDNTRAHKPDEYISKEEMWFDMCIIAEAIITLAQQYSSLIT